MLNRKNMSILYVPTYKGHQMGVKVYALKNQKMSLIGCAIVGRKSYNGELNLVWFVLRESGFLPKHSKYYYKNNKPGNFYDRGYCAAKGLRVSRLYSI